ncbi:MAG: TRAP transporter permease [Syntrophomonadaceae bacterium]|nr:TRAP transporter permease [Syntrophomonadaceae bacterium]
MKEANHIERPLEDAGKMASRPLVTRVLYNDEKMDTWLRIGRGLIAVLGVLIALGAIYTARYGPPFPAWQFRSLFVGLMLILTFYYHPFRKGKVSLLMDVVPFLLALATTAYMFFQYPGTEYRAGLPILWDLVFGSILIFLIIEGCRRSNGWPVAIVAGFFMCYIFIGPYLPGLLGHRGFHFDVMIDYMFVTSLGIFGDLINITATVLILFVLFGAFLVKSGIGRFFIDLACALLGRVRGGPALVAVVSSAMIGTVTGNGVANVTITGAFTIPLMKRIGYRKEFAGAVEAVASQGGQIMPPIMGASAFIMADTLGVPYIKIAGMALIPAILYFFTAGVVVYLEARKTGMQGMQPHEMPHLWTVLRKGWYMMTPLILIVALLIIGYSPMMAGFWAIVSCIVLSWINYSNRIGLLGALEALEDGVRSSIAVVMAVAAAAIIVGSVVMTGLGIRFSRLAIELSGGELVPLLFLVMIASLILGMGMPTVAAYVVLAMLAAPALERLDVPAIAAHLYVFYFGIISGITPPVAITAYVAAGMAGGNAVKTAWEAARIGVAGFMVPYMFIFNNELLLQGTTAEIIQIAVTSMIGITCFAVVLQGWLLRSMNWMQRVLMLVVAFLTIDPGLVTDLIGAVLIGLTIAWQLVQNRKEILTAETGRLAKN